MILRSPCVHGAMDGWQIFQTTPPRARWTARCFIVPSALGGDNFKKKKTSKMHQELFNTDADPMVRFPLFGSATVEE